MSQQQNREPCGHCELVAVVYQMEHREALLRALPLGILNHYPLSHKYDSFDQWQKNSFLFEQKILLVTPLFVCFNSVKVKL